MNWFWYALLSAIFITIYSLLVRVALKNKGDAKAFTFLLDFSAGLFLLIISLFEKRYCLLNLKLFLLIISLTLVYAMVDILFIRGRQLEEVSKVSLVVQIGSVWSFLGAIIFLKEALLLNKVFGVFLIITGNVIALWQKQKFKLSKGLQIIILAAILFASGSLVDKYMVGEIVSPALYKSVILLITSFWIFLFIPKRFKRIGAEIRLQKISVVLTGLFFGLGMFFLMKGFQVGEASKVLPIHSLSLILSVLAGIFLLGEKERKWQKILGALVAFAGVFLLKGI